MSHRRSLGPRKRLPLGHARDAQALPYPDGFFDAAYLNVTLGELPDQAAALRELARVLKREGRLVVGEILGDPHWVPLGTLRARAEVAGLTLERRLGGPLGYYARFRPDGHRRGGDDRLNLQRLNPQGAAGGLPGVGAP